MKPDTFQVLSVKKFNVLFESAFPEECEQFEERLCYFYPNGDSEDFVSDMTEDQADKLIEEMTELYGDRLHYFKREIVQEA